MVIDRPDYYSAFHCLAGRCPHSCCEKWEVTIDGETARYYRSLPGTLGERLRRALKEDADGELCFPLDGGRCPFWRADGLCEIHAELGEAATSVTCREHPRFLEDYGPFREVTLSASCPAANALLLGSTKPLGFVREETGEPGEEGDPWLVGLVPLRRKMMGLLARRDLPLRLRLRRYLLLAERAQDLLDQEQVQALADLAEPAEELCPEVPDGPGLFPALLVRMMTLEALDPDWHAVLDAACTAPPAAAAEELLERIGTYCSFRYLLKAVNDGDLLSRAQLCVAAVLTVERLAAAGLGLPEALRRWSCEIEHDDDNLDALLDAFRTDPALSPAAFYRELAGTAQVNTQ